MGIMWNRIRFGLVVLAVALAAPGAFAQAVVEIKTPPLQESETYQLPLTLHSGAPPWAGWAGAIVKYHVVDPSEVDVTAIHANLPARTPFGTLMASSSIMDPFGPPSANMGSVPLTLTFWHPNAQNSGVPSSLSIPISTLVVHAKNTTPLNNNSDTDLTTMIWNIFHLLPGSQFASQIVTLRASDLVWVFSNVTMSGQLHTTLSAFRFPESGPTPFNPDGHWLHLSMTLPFHLTTGPGSAFYATMFRTANIGIEHVPEPASAFLVGGGLLALALGGHARQRRLRTA